MSNHNITQRGIRATGLGVMIGRCSPDSQLNAKHGLEKTINLHYTAILGATFHKGYRKRMIKIWQECANFQTTSQKLADQVRTMIKKGWFSDLEILDIHQKTNTQGNNIESSVVKQNQPDRNELPSSENENATLPNNAQPSNPKETLSQEQKIDLETQIKNLFKKPPKW